MRPLDPLERALLRLHLQARATPAQAPLPMPPGPQLPDTPLPSAQPGINQMH